MSEPSFAPRDVPADELRQLHYNATVEDVRHLHDSLMIIRVRPDGEKPSYKPGQYATLGLGVWEPRVDGTLPTYSDDATQQKVIKRAYSIACPLLAEDRLAPCSSYDYLEFYITLVLRPDDDRPPLTPRLFALKPGARIQLGKKPVGSYTLDAVSPDDNLIFAATGTGEAPHNAMAAELLATGHAGKIASLTCVRYRQDAGYADVQDRLQSMYDNYAYRVLTTREPENSDQTRADYVGKKYLQDYVQSGEFAEDLGWSPQAENTHVFLCGNPDMIGLPKKNAAGELEYPQPTGMAEILARLGFQLDHPRQPGNIHFEKYW